MANSDQDSSKQHGIAECGVRIEKSIVFFNPHSALRTPQLGRPVATAPGSDLPFILSRKFEGERKGKLLAVADNDDVCRLGVIRLEDGRRV